MRNPAALDLEMTGLSSATNVILELGLLLATPDLEIIGGFGSRVVHAAEEDLELMSDFVRNMHTETGLLDEVRASTLTVADLDDEVTEWLAAHGHVEHENPQDRTAMILGSSCRVDLNFIEEHMPHLARVLHYRMIDVTGVRESLAMWVPELELSEPFEVALEDGWVAHRAANDARWTLGEARGIRNVVKALTGF